MAEAVHKTGNGVLIDIYAQKTALRLGVQPDAVRSEFRKMPKAQDSSPEPEESESGPQLEASPAPSALELVLLKVLIDTDEHVARVSQYIEPQWISHSLGRGV